MKAIRKDYRKVSKDILTQITGGENVEEIEYRQGLNSYQLSSKPVEKISKITGIHNGTGVQFNIEEDFRLIANQVEWLPDGRHPDQGTEFEVSYWFSRPAGISDVSPGSVVRTIVEAISREIDFLYSQMEEVHESGFLETAEGEALDMVVSLLGITRKPPKPSSGQVTFGRASEPETVANSEEVHLFDGSDEYELKKPLVEEVSSVEGTVEGEEHTFQPEVDYIVVENRIRWVAEGTKPDPRTVFRVDYTSYNQIIVPKGASVSTFSSTPEEARTFTTTEEGELSPTEEGRWEADVPVVCDQPGTRGNVLAGTITVMPQPVPGIEYVINKGDITNGVGTETDEELRERARHALEFAGRATVSSLESAVGAVEGVRSLLVEDMPEDVPGIVAVIADGGDGEEIQAVIDETRAAGIKVEFSRPKRAYIDVSFILTLKKSADAPGVLTEAEMAVRSYISFLGIGEDVLYSRVIDSALKVNQVIDVREVKLTAHKEGEIVQSEKENITISSRERAEPRNMDIDFELK